jgi:uncharacterized protein (TIGR02996 family)
MSEMLQQAIAAQPDDDLARLAFADWLEENGRTEQGRFIRLQLEQARAGIASAAAARMGREAEALLAQNECAWLGPWAERLVRWRFRRGFLDSVTLEPEVFLTWGEELFADHPVREVCFVTSEGESCGGDVAEELVAAPAFRHVRAVSAGGCDPSAGPGWCRALAEATHVERLEELDLSSSWRPDDSFHDLDSLTQLCQADHLRSLRKLILTSPMAYDAFSDAAIEVLLQAPFAANLTELALGGWHLSDAGACALAGSRKLRRLVDLDLSWCERLSRTGIQAVLNSPHLRKLTRLGLGSDIDLHDLAAAPLLGRLEQLDLCTAGTRYNRSFPAEAWGRLATSPHVGRLRRLALLHNLLSVEGAIRLLHTPGSLRLHSLLLMGVSGDSPGLAPVIATSPALAELTALELVACSIDHQSVEALMEAHFVPNLRLLCLAGNRIQARGLQAVLRSQLSAGSLDDLHLHHCELPPSVLRRLVRWRGLANVVRLEMGSNHFDLQTMDALARSPVLARLTTLHLGSGHVSPEALMVLTQPGILPRLRELTVSNNVPEQAVQALRIRFGPRLHINTRE